jgi:aminopeptidase N
MLLAEKKDNKSLANYIHQYTYAGNYLDRREAIDFAADSQDPKAFDLLKTAARDKYYGLRAYTLTKLDFRNNNVETEMEPILADLAKNDPKPTVRAAALGILSGYVNDKYKDLFTKDVNDSSYSVAGAALEGLMVLDSSSAIAAAKKMSGEKIKGKLLESVTKVLMATGDVSGFDMIAKTFDNMPISQSKFNLIQPLSQMLIKMDDTEKVKKGVDLIVEFRDAIPAEYGIAPYINNLLNNIVAKKSAAGGNSQEQIEYIKGKIAGK